MGDRYVLRIVASARKDLLRIPEPHRQRLRVAIRQLAIEPRPPEIEMLAGRHDPRQWRIRVGDYRIIYEIQDVQLLVLVVRLGHRGEVYRLR